MIDAWVLGILLVTATFVGAVYALSPRAALGGLFFGVTVAPGFHASDLGRGVAAHYRTVVLAWSAAALAALAAALPLDLIALGGAALLLQVAGCTLAWLGARRAALPHAVRVATSIRSASLAPLGGALSPLLDLVGFALLACAAMLLLRRWGAIPERFVTHWGTHGPDGWGTRTPGDVLGPLGHGAVIAALLVALRWWIVLSTPSGATPRARATLRLTGLALVGASWMTSGLFAAAALQPLTGGPGLVLAVAGVGLLTLAGTLVVGLRRLSRLPPDPPGAATPDAAWRAGLFYVNRDDPALWVPKRMGVGYTLNLGHPGGKLLLAFLVTLPLAIAVGSLLLSR
jgi:hypothetical protein